MDGQEQPDGDHGPHGLLHRPRHRVAAGAGIAPGLDAGALGDECRAARARSRAAGRDDILIRNPKSDEPRITRISTEGAYGPALVASEIIRKSGGCFGGEAFVPPTPPHPTTTADSDRPARILIADDNPQGVELLEAYLAGT